MDADEAEGQTTDRGYERTHDPTLRRGLRQGSFVYGFIQGGGNPHYVMELDVRNAAQFLNFVANGSPEDTLHVGDREMVLGVFRREFIENLEKVSFSHDYTTSFKSCVPIGDY